MDQRLDTYKILLAPAKLPSRKIEPICETWQLKKCYSSQLLNKEMAQTINVILNILKYNYVSIFPTRLIMKRR